MVFKSICDGIRKETKFLGHMSEAERHRFFQAREKIRELTTFMNEKRVGEEDPDLEETLRSEVAEMAYRRRNASRDSAEVLSRKFKEVQEEMNIIEQHEESQSSLDGGINLTLDPHQHARSIDKIATRLEETSIGEGDMQNTKEKFNKSKR